LFESCCKQILIFRRGTSEDTQILCNLGKFLHVAHSFDQLVTLAFFHQSANEDTELFALHNGGVWESVILVWCPLTWKNACLLSYSDGGGLVVTGHHPHPNTSFMAEFDSSFNAIPEWVFDTHHRDEGKIFLNIIPIFRNFCNLFIG
jgi:hypothetical protein